MAKKATLQELRTVYTLDDVVYLNEVEDYEIERAATERAQQEQGKRK
jgi:hypothetical protein